MKPGFLIILLWGALCAPSFAQKGIYLSEENLLRQAFSLSETSSLPTKQSLWMNDNLKKQEKLIFGHNKKSLRQTYYQFDQRRVWILNCIGKEMPITMGFVVENNHITSAHVLVYRESRGGEIRLPAYTAQFNNISLNADKKLTQKIDGISGATLSVRASTKMAQFALILDEYLQQQNRSTEQLQ